jgi:hypothetical protein
MIINGLAQASVKVVGGLAIVSAKTWEGLIDFLNEDGTYLLLETNDKMLKETGHGGH